MQPLVLYGIVLFAALAHACWNAMVKASGDRLLMLASIRAVGLAAGLAVALLVPLPSPESLPFLAAAALVHYLYYALMLGAYRVGDLSQVYPISRGVAPLLVAFLAAALGGEVLGRTATLALLFISGGIFALAIAKGRVNRQALLFALFTGIAIAGYSFLSGLGVRRSESVLGYIAWLEIATGIGMLGIAVATRERKVLGDYVRGQWRVGLLAGLLSVGGYAIALWAMSVLALAPVVALRETSVVFAALIGATFLREGHTAQRLLATLAVLLGVILLASGGDAS